jgi:hypothetical protein
VSERSLVCGARSAVAEQVDCARPCDEGLSVDKTDSRGEWSSSPGSPENPLNKGILGGGGGGGIRTLEPPVTVNGFRDCPSLAQPCALRAGARHNARQSCATQSVVGGPEVSTLPSRLVPITFSCVRQLAFVFEFPARFEVAQLERVDRQAWERVARDRAPQSRWWGYGWGGVIRRRVERRV